ncbi:MAG: LacI family DNA-binding transcriptional regulator [Chloroflexota bacterium]|nr:LacI family DNA-binding transcriptional regulator [Chloroflexota bacterium]
MEALPSQLNVELGRQLDFRESNVAVTIYEVANQAGVGIGTVSRVLNDSPNVSPETRQRVLNAIEALDYRPSPIAQRLSLRRTLTIGVIVPFFTRPSTVERLRGIEAAIADTYYDLTIYNVETVARRDSCFAEVPAAGRVDGVIVISLRPTDEDVARWNSVGVPVVLVDAFHPELSCIAVDDVEGGYQATKHLIDLGHTHIAFTGDLVDQAFGFRSSWDRYQGYCNALQDFHLPQTDGYYRTAEHGREQARAMTHELLSLPAPPTAIVSASDTQALGVIEAARDLGLRYPGQLSVIGYDDIEVAGFINLTTMRQPLFETGQQGFQLLLRAIELPTAEIIHQRMPVSIVERGTTVAPGRAPLPENQPIYRANDREAGFAPGLES